MFRGATKVTLDAKGRMVMPTRYRERLAERGEAQLVVTIDRDQCLLIYPLPDWEEIERKLMRLPTLNEHARQNDPFANVGRLTVSVELQSVVRASDTSFQMRWIERSFENGVTRDIKRWTAVLTVVITPPRSAEMIAKNPLGIYVHALNWSQDLSPGDKK